MLHHVVSALGHNSGDCILEFLSVLPEEVTEGRKISLSVRTVGRLQAHTRLERSIHAQKCHYLTFLMNFRKMSFQVELESCLTKTLDRFLGF